MVVEGSNVACEAVTCFQRSLVDGIKKHVSGGVIICWVAVRHAW